MNKIKDIEITKKRILKGKNNKPSYDFYKLKIIYSDNTSKTITVFTDLNAIDINNREQTKSFMINSLFGTHGLIKEQGRDDYIFLGRPTKDVNGKTIPYRFYKMENSNKNAQQYFDEFVYPRLKKIFSSNKQIQPASLYDEIKSPFDDINVIKKIVELYINLPSISTNKIVKKESDLYHDITHYDFCFSNDKTKHVDEFWNNIGYPCINELYNNIKRSKNDEFYNDIITRTIINKFKDYNELIEYISNNEYPELDPKYNEFMYHYNYSNKYSQESFIAFKEKYSINIPIENIKFNIFTYATYNKLIFRFKDVEGGGSMGFHINPQNLKSQDANYHNLNSEMKFYINAGYNTYRFAKYFKEKCEQKNLNYYFKVVDPLYNEQERSDKLCIYTEYENANTYLQIIKDIIKEHPDIKYRKPPLTAGIIQDIIGVGSDTISHGGSYNQKMSEICFNTLENFFKGKNKTEVINTIDKNSNLLYIIRENIIKHARELGLSEKICLSEDAVLQLTNNKSKRR